MHQDTISLFQEPEILNIINNHNFQSFRDLKQSFLRRMFDGMLRFTGSRLNNAVKQIIGSFHLPGKNILEDENVTIDDVNFYNNTNDQHITTKDILETDTSDINRLAHIGIEISIRERQPNGNSVNRTYRVNVANNSQRAFVIRYIQLCYVKFMRS